MPALIPELIAMASDPTVTTTDLLFKALVAARKLKQADWARWLELEIEGYPEGVELPSYRIVVGQVYAAIPEKGAKRLPIKDLGLHEAMSQCRLHHAIAGLEPLAAGERMVTQEMSPKHSKDLSKLYGQEFLVYVQFGSNQVRCLIDSVRYQVLRWALDLSDAGIEGEGMSFTPQEQQQAQQLAPGTHIHIAGDFTGGQMMVSSPGGRQQQTVTSEQKETALAALLPWLTQVIAQGQLQGDACAELQVELDTLKAQAASPNPKWPVIGAVAGSVLAILEGAGGGVLAGQALGWLTTLSGG